MRKKIEITKLNFLFALKTRKFFFFIKKSSKFCVCKVKSYKHACSFFVHKRNFNVYALSEKKSTKMNICFTREENLKNENWLNFQSCTWWILFVEQFLTAPPLNFCWMFKLNFSSFFFSTNKNFSCVHEVFLFSASYAHNNCAFSIVFRGRSTTEKLSAKDEKFTVNFSK